jgi:hypothetical protein
MSETRMVATYARVSTIVKIVVCAAAMRIGGQGANRAA